MIENMQPGRELDALVAEKVMVNRKQDIFSTHWGKGPFQYDLEGNAILWRPSTDWNDMRLVVEEMRKREDPFCIDIETGCSSYTVKVADTDGYTDIWVIRESAPHAVCIAALLALAEEDTNNE